ncbi:hypothetical protein [Kushneria aurantia]|uniref:Uncharacterized protein n=1 Tax=Kushneria aurantia TaxID=504092 RepID=A0ABV6G3K8_9GAMM|nr:hypothetical protein [Kushneria aurantia]
MATRNAFIVTAALTLASLTSSALGAEMPIIEGERFHPLTARHGMVVTSHELATRVGRDMLRGGRHHAGLASHAKKI